MTLFENVVCVSWKRSNYKIIVWFRAIWVWLSVFSYKCIFCFHSHCLLQTRIPLGLKEQLYPSSNLIFLFVCPTKFRGVVPGGAGGAMSPPDFGRSVNPISTKGGRLCPPNNTGTPGFSDFPMTLNLLLFWNWSRL